MHNSTAVFYRAIKAAGLEPPAQIEPGKLHRIPGLGKSQNNRSGWCLLFADGMGGSFGDWSCGMVESWHAQRCSVLSNGERAVFAQQLKAARALAAAELQVRHLDAAKRATLIWNGSNPAPSNHPYLIRKIIQPHGARLHKNALVLPVMNHSGDLNSLQFI